MKIEKIKEKYWDNIDGTSLGVVGFVQELISRTEQMLAELEPHIKSERDELLIELGISAFKFIDSLKKDYMKKMEEGKFASNTWAFYYDGNEMVNIYQKLKDMKNGWYLELSKEEKK